jgi:hypothetical protein
MKVLIVASQFNDLPELFAALQEDVTPILYDFYAPFPTIHTKVMNSLRHLQGVTHVGVAMPRDAEEKAAKLSFDDAPLPTGQSKQWSVFGVLATSIFAITGLDKIYVLNAFLDSFEFAAIQKELRRTHELTVANNFDWRDMDGTSAKDLFFTDALDKYCRAYEIAPKAQLSIILEKELASKLGSLTCFSTPDDVAVTSSVIGHSNFNNIWTKLKEVVDFKTMQSDVDAIDYYFADPNFGGLQAFAKNVMRIVFSVRRESLDTPIGSNGMTFAACIELILLPVLKLDSKILANMFYGFVFGKDDELKARILTYIDSEAFASKLVEQLPPVPLKAEAEDAVAEEPADEPEVAADTA